MKTELHNDPLYSAVGRAAGNRGGCGKLRLDEHSYSPAARVAALEELARGAKKVTEEHAYMERAGRARTASGWYEDRKWRKRVK